MVDGIRWEPTVPDGEFFRRIPHRRDRVRLRLARGSVRSLDLRRWLSRGSVTAAAVTLDLLEAAVRSDRNLPPGGEPAPYPLPVPRVGGHLSVDTVRVRGRVRYAEVPAGRRRPGRVSFDSLVVSARHLATDPAAVSLETPTVVQAEARVFGTVPARLRASIFRLEPRLGLELEGGAGPAALEPVNAVLLPLEGLRIDAGRLDSLWFRVDLEETVATGGLVAVYRDLRISVRDPETGGGGLANWARSVVAGWRVRSDNLPGEDGSLRSGRIAEPVAPAS